ncbi:MAG: carboxypeptidase regulatory-like domain-containing protein [Planctomycetes bacterium]|nr:carboxypeptidase regulatory-like domain-containing protein [Planctomycetota bacterium]
MRAFRPLVLATAVAAGVLLAPGRAAAHALHADVTVGAEIKLLAYYDEDAPAEFAEVVVTDSDGTVVLRGKTDEKGVWSFPAPKPGAYTLAVKSVGHTAKVPFEVPGAPADGPVTYTEWRPSKPLGLALGAGGLLGLSALYWLARRKRWVE